MILNTICYIYNIYNTEFSEKGYRILCLAYKNVKFSDGNEINIYSDKKIIL